MQKQESTYNFEGLSQDARYPEQLNFGYVRVDEMSFEDLLVFATGFSHLIKYFDANNADYTDWSEIFIDETMVIAEIMTINPTEIEKKFKSYIDKAQLFRRKTKKAEYVIKASEQIITIASLFDHWITKLAIIEKQTNTELKLRIELDEILNTYLDDEINKLYKLSIDTNSENEKFNQIKTKIESLIQFQIKKSGEIELVESDENIEQSDWIYSLTEQFEQIFNTFYQTLFFIKNKSADYMRQSLNRSNHLPQMALFLTFLKLYKYSQDNINQFNQRFLDYYYQTILKIDLKSYKADIVYLTAKLIDRPPNFLIKQGEAFLAGDDAEGNSIVYTANNPIRINRATIKKLHSFYISRQALSIKGIAIPYVTNIHCKEIPESAFITKDNEQPFSIFGTDQSKIGIIERTMTEAASGFAFSSKNLYLKNGKREVEIELNFSDKSYKNLSKYVDNFAASTQKLRSEILDTMFLNAFHIELSASNGWYKINRFSAFINEESKSINIGFIIPQNAPSIVPYDKEIHTGKFQTKHPVAKFRLNPETYIYPYSILQSMHLESINVNVEVQGFKDLDVYNYLGKLDIQNVFQPFGPLPKKKYYCVIGSNEVFYKELQDLSIYVRWFELPETEGGFEGYYENYKLDIDNECFKAKISVLDSGKWKPDIKDQQEFNLFAEDKEHQLEQDIQIEDIDISKIWRGFEEFDYNEEFIYNHQTQSGFIKIELSAPGFAFGHDVYPSLLAAGMSKNAKGFNLFGSAKADVPDLPQPYTPQIEELSIDYKASSSILFSEAAKTIDLMKSDGEHFYHIYNFGEVLMYPKASVRKVNMLPDYNFEGCFTIGLSGIEAPQVVSFLFVLSESAVESSEEKEPVTEWQYLANDTWITIEPSKIYLDETENFRQTGIITIEIPDGAQNGNKQLDENLFWIRVVAYKNTNVAASILTAHTQAFTATLDTENEILEENYGNVLPAGTITRPLGNLPEIDIIEQPLDSFKGLKPERMKDYYQRISEKLKHKNRAVTSEDFEKIILGNFNQIFQATCFPNMAESGLNVPGHVLIVVVPFSRFSLDRDEPKVGNKMLVEIKNHLQNLASPFIHIEVRNPVYEHVKIVSKVKFKSGFSKGFYLRELNNHLTGFLHGKTDEEKRQVALGGSIFISDILSFMRSLPYIDSVGALSVLQIAKDFRGRFILIDSARLEGGKNFISATKPWSVLVPFAEHDLTVVDEELSVQTEPAGIGQLKLGSELVIE